MPGWTRKKKGRNPLWHCGVLVTRCGLLVVGHVFYQHEMPEDLGHVCWKCRSAEMREPPQLSAAKPPDEALGSKS